MINSIFPIPLFMLSLIVIQKDNTVKRFLVERCPRLDIHKQGFNDKHFHVIDLSGQFIHWRITFTRGICCVFLLHCFQCKSLRFFHYFERCLVSIDTVFKISCPNTLKVRFLVFNQIKTTSPCFSKRFIFRTTPSPE